MAVLVLGTALVALVRMLTLGRLSAEVDAKRVVALEIVRNRAATLHTRGYDTLENEPVAPIPDNPGYSQSITVTAAGAGLKLVTVTVYWQSPTGIQVSESVQFLAADTVLPMRTQEVP